MRVIRLCRITVEQGVARQCTVERNRPGNNRLVRIAGANRTKEAETSVLHRSQTLPVNAHEIKKFITAGEPVSNDGIYVLGDNVAQRRHTPRHLYGRNRIGMIFHFVQDSVFTPLAVALYMELITFESRGVRIKPSLDKFQGTV